ncbi:hypothetical protein H2136_22160 [Aeromonas hydrophila]|uniref:Cytochrome c assembly protein domain-containing protein n=1 Tax=Aeromonas hydrophila TaxID=644 RepID=A0A926IZ79_AERHY|nr:hypothetical protein [Aeromonas hydrophila]
MLQDIGLIIHPPLLYLGYVGFAVNFAFAMAALHSGRLDGAVAHWSRPWALGSGCFSPPASCWAPGGLIRARLGRLVVLGSVENALLPWLLGTALLHALVVCEKRGAYGHAVVALHLYFLAEPARHLRGALRVLTSVHAFAVDPSRGLTLLLLLGLLLTCALTLFALWADIRAPMPALACCQRGLLGAAILLLSVACASVLLGTFYPMVFQSLHLGSSRWAPLFQYHLRAAGPLPDGADDPAAAPALAASGSPAPHQGAAPMPVWPAGGTLLSLAYPEPLRASWLGLAANVLSLWLMASLLPRSCNRHRCVSSPSIGSAACWPTSGWRCAPSALRR